MEVNGDARGNVPTTHRGVAGDLIIKATTRLGFAGSTTIRRSDHGVAWNAPLETGCVLVSESVALEFEISALPVWCQPTQCEPAR